MTLTSRSVLTKIEVQMCACVCTCVDEASRRSFAELLGFVGQCDFHDPRDVSGWRLNTDGVGRDELKHSTQHVQLNAHASIAQTAKSPL